MEANFKIIRTLYHKNHIWLLSIVKITAGGAAMWSVHKSNSDMSVDAARALFQKEHNRQVLAFIREEEEYERKMGYRDASTDDKTEHSKQILNGL